tara:strand:- start:914 stop:1153 length:240 start_codon:yes stop_codon:yes gene_type:complete
MNLLIEGVAVGIVVLVVGTIVGFILGRFMSVDLPKACREWNKNHIMEISLFLTGFLTHIIFELFGLNNWYCKHGRACQK